MSFFKSLFNKQILKHSSLAIGAIILFVIIVFISLSIYTRHGDSYEVPDFKGLTEAQFKEIIEDKDFRYLITDSIHVDGATPGAVVEQLPEPKERVKKNRTIHFTINAVSAEKVQVPNLVDYSLRNAKVILESYGLELGELVYAPSEYTNLVLGQLFEGKPVEPGTQILKGSIINLVVGNGLGSTRTNIPDLFGLRIDEAKNLCQTSSLNIGAVIYDETIISKSDSLIAIIWKQNPEPKPGTRLRLGSSIDVWLSLDSTKTLPDTTQTVEVITEQIDETF